MWCTYFICIGWIISQCNNGTWSIFSQANFQNETEKQRNKNEFQWNKNASILQFFPHITIKMQVLWEFQMAVAIRTKMFKYIKMLSIAMDVAADVQSAIIFGEVCIKCLCKREKFPWLSPLPLTTPNQSNPNVIWNFFILCVRFLSLRWNFRIKHT